MKKMIVKLQCDKCGSSFNVDYSPPTSESSMVSETNCPNCDAPLPILRDCLLVDGRLHSPHWIFVLTRGAEEDLAILDNLGASEYTFANPPNTLCKIFITNDERWIHVADNLAYPLFNQQGISRRIAELAKYYDIFRCWYNDTDDGFGFEFYRQSVLVRRMIVEDYNHGAGPLETVCNDGPPLPGEKEALEEPDLLRRIMSLAAGIGIQTNYLNLNIRIYSNVTRR